MAPPDLAGDAPIPDVVHPAVKGIVPGFRIEGDAAILYRRHRLVGQRPDRDEPLQRGGRLDDRLAAVTVTDSVVVRFDFFQIPLLLEVVDNLAAAGEAVEPGIGARLLVHNPFFVHYLELGQIVALADFVIVAVVGGRHFQGASPEILLHVIVEHHRDNAIDQRQPDADIRQVRIPFVIGMHRHRGIAEHGLGAGGGDDHRTGTIGIRVTDVIEFALGVLMLHLVVGESCVAARTPVDDVVAFIDQAFFIEPYEDLADRPGQPLVHGEPLPLPVAGSAQFFELVDDGAALVPPPLPDLFDKGVATEIMASLAFQGQLPLNHVLGGDTGVIGAGNPHRIVPAHPVVTDQNILQGVIEGMPDMQNTGNVGGRDDDREGRSAFFHGGRETLGFLPFLQPFAFYFGKFVSLTEQLLFFLCHNRSLTH